jgi:ribosomal protein L7Ae-like RNA K-turn-binding protein
VGGSLRKVYNLIGIAQRAGLTSSGATAVHTSLIKRRACILLMSRDIADNTRDLLIKSCMKTNIPWLTIGNKFELGASLGKAHRVALTINDAGMASAIVKAIQTAGNEAKSMGVVEWPR